MKIVITGGHFTPAYALIEQLQKNNDIVIIGRKHALEGSKIESYESQVSKKHGIRFIPLTTARLSRKLTKYSVASFLRAPIGFAQAITILKKEKPDIVLSFGGYISLPVCIAAKILSIPIVIHEQTQGAGLANKYTAKLATVVCISFKSSEHFFPESKTVLTGLPVRSEVFQVKKTMDLSQSKPIVYITGGSTGSHFINQLIGSIIKQLLSSYSIIHQTGESEYNDFKNLEEIRDQLSTDEKSRYIIRKYIFPEEIGWIYKHADIIIGRAGINTVNEILTLKKRALLIPLPHGQSGEQLSNAELIKKSGYGDYIIQEHAHGQEFLEKLNKVKDLKLPKESSKDANIATQEIINVLQSVYEKRTTEKPQNSNT